MMAVNGIIKNVTINTPISVIDWLRGTKSLRIYIRKDNAE